jgi:hypothetical protein
MNTRNVEGLIHSANVRMELRLNSLVLPISHLGPGFLILSNPIDHPPAEAEVIMSVDGSESRWLVQLPAGISLMSRRTSISPSQCFNGSTVG